MPDIQGIYYSHPDTQEFGIWVMIKNDRIRGMAYTEMQAYVQQHNITMTNVGVLVDYVEGWVNDGLTDKIPQNTFFAGWLKADEDAWRANPPQFYSIVGGQVYVQRSVFTLEVFSVDPLAYLPTVSRGASGGIIVPG